MAYTQRARYSPTSQGSVSTGSQGESQDDFCTFYIKYNSVLSISQKNGLQINNNKTGMNRFQDCCKA